MDAGSPDPERRVLLVLTEFPPRIGGMQVHAVALADHLARRGCRITILTYRPSLDREAEERTLDESLPYPVERTLSRVAHFENLAVLERAVDRFKPDLVYCSTVFYGALADRCDIPVICRSAGNDVLRPWIGYPFRRFSRLVGTKWFEQRLYRFFEKLEYPDWLHMIFRRRRRLMMEEAARKHRVVLANSQFTSEQLMNVGVDPDRIRVLSGGVDVERFSGVRPEDPCLRAALAIPPDRFVILAACRLERRKGVDFLIRSMDRLVRRVPDAHLLVVGDGRARRQLEMMAASSAAAGRITFAGPISHDRMPAVFAIAQAFVLASRLQVDPITGLVDAETMGRVLCEANAASVPAVAARSGGIPSVIEHGENGLLFTPDDTGEYIDCVAEVHGDPTTRAALVQRGRARAEAEFDWPEIFRVHEELFERLLRSPTSATLAAE